MENNQIIGKLFENMNSVLEKLNNVNNSLIRIESQNQYLLTRVEKIDNELSLIKKEIPRIENLDEKIKTIIEWKNNIDKSVTVEDLGDIKEKVNLHEQRISQMYPLVSEIMKMRINTIIGAVSVSTAVVLILQVLKGLNLK